MTEPVPPTTGVQSAAEPDLDLSASEVADLLLQLAKSVRAFQIYESNNPVYQRFVDGLKNTLADLWRRTSALELIVDEAGFRYGEEVVAPADSRDSLPYLFYMDGIRHLKLLPGFEDEIEKFLAVVHKARVTDRMGDDLVTLLWEQDFGSFQYGYVDILAEGLELPGVPDPSTPAIGRERIAADLMGDLEPAWSPGEASAGDIVASITREDFDETLYFLDDAELQTLQQEVEREWSRDLRTDVLNALFDRLEDGKSERQTEILDILRQLLPNFLARGELAAATHVLRELDAILAANPPRLGEAQRVAVGRLLDEMSDPEVLGQLIDSIQSGGVVVDVQDLAVFLEHLRPIALPVLIRAAETAKSQALHERLPPAIEHLARQQVSHLVGLLESPDATVARGAARLVGRLRIASAAPGLAKLMDSPDVDVRRAAVAALADLRSSQAIEPLQRALEDPDRDVRITAARGLGELRIQSVRERFEAIIKGRGLREADLTEKRAFFEAYGSLAGNEGVPFLDRILNGRSLLRRREPSDMRACAAIGLGKIGSPAARAALQRAGSDADPVVRSAVNRALRREATGT